MPAGSIAPHLKDLPGKAPARLVFWTLFLLLAITTGFRDVTHYPYGDTSSPRLIGHADQANMAVVARNLAEGKGAVVDAIWLHTNGGIKGGEIPIPEPYWSIYVAAIIAVFFYFWGASLTVMLIPAVLMKTAIAALAALVTFRLNKSYLTAFAVAAFLLCDLHIAMYVCGLSDIYLAFFVLLTCLTLAFAISKDSPLLFFLVGLLVGITIGVKPSGALTLGLLIGYLFFTGNFSRAIRRLALTAIGIVIGLAPLVSHNYQAFGTIYSPAQALVNEANDIIFLLDTSGGKWVGRLSRTKAVFDPEPYPYTEDELQKLKGISQEVAHITKFGKALFRGALVPQWLLPFAFIAILWVLFNVRRIFIYRNASFEILFAYIAVQMLIAGVVLGFVVHMEARYWLFMAPFLAIGSISVIGRCSKLLTVALLGYILFTSTNVYYPFTSAPLPKAYSMAAEILPEGAVVFTTYPWQFAFHTRRAAVALPYTRDPEVLFKLKDRYNVDYIAIVDKELRNSFFRFMIDGELPAYLEHVYISDDLVIAKFR